MNNQSAQIPQRTEVYIDGLLYKIGLRGMVFVKVGGQWIRSSRTPDEVVRAARLAV